MDSSIKKKFQSQLDELNSAFISKPACSTTSASAESTSTLPTEASLSTGNMDSDSLDVHYLKDEELLSQNEDIEDIMDFDNPDTLNDLFNIEDLDVVLASAEFGFPQDYLSQLDNAADNDNYFEDIALASAMDVSTLDEESNTKGGGSFDKYCKMAMGLDGAYGQIVAITKFITKLDNAKDTLFIKYSGGASMTQSPNDVGHCHMVLHSLYRSNKYKDCNNIADPEGPHWQELKSFLKTTL
jgi:hypothetical protein